MSDQLQDLVDGVSARRQRERAETQLTLGELIEALEGMPEGAMVANLRGLHSYRGYYEDLAFRRGEGLRLATELLMECRKAMGRTYTGYKGGWYVMGEMTPLWVAPWGSTGERLLEVAAGGGILMGFVGSRGGEG